jgi:hypothetical protein
MNATFRTVGMAMILAAAGGFAVGADDVVYDLRGPAPEKGQIYHTKMLFEMKGADVTLKVGGQTLKLKQTMTVTNVEDEKVLAVEGRQVIRSQAKVTKDFVEIVVDNDGQQSTDKHAEPLEGEVILSERTGDGKWKHSLVDTKATEKQKKELDKRLGPENDDELYPEGKVKVGHTWTVDAAAMKKFFGNSFTDIKGKLDQKFLKVEDVKGEACAVIEGSGPIEGKMKDDDESSDLKVKMDLKITSWRSLKTGVELKTKFSGKIKITGKQKVDDAQADVVIEGPISGGGGTTLK